MLDRFWLVYFVAWGTCVAFFGAGIGLGVSTDSLLSAGVLITLVLFLIDNHQTRHPQHKSKPIYDEHFDSDEDDDDVHMTQGGGKNNQMYMK